MDKGSLIGKRMPRIDGIPKICGSALYTDDIKLPGMLYGKIVRSPIPHGRIMNIDTSRVKRLRGVKAIVTGKDLGKGYGLYKIMGREEFWDEYALAIDKVRYIGDEVAAVAATSQDIAEEALDLFDVEFEELPPIFDPEDAMASDAPKIHEDRDNIALKIEQEMGEVDKAFGEVNLLREDLFETQMMNHCTMEPHAVIAHYDHEGRLTVFSSQQKPFEEQLVLASSFDLPKDRVRVIKPFLGGGFGAKADVLSLDFCASLLSMRTRLPVKITYTREEVFVATRQRHPMRIFLKTGIKRDGIINALECKVITDNGAYNSRGPVVMLGQASDLTLIYKVPNFRYRGFLVYTNNIPGGALRGFGKSQVRFAQEMQMDLIARDLGMEPLELRKRNAVAPGETTRHGLKVTTCAFKECLVEIEKDVQKKGETDNKMGVGTAGVGFASGVVEAQTAYPSGAHLEIDEAGKATLFTGAADIGQGSDTILCQIAAEELGISMEDLRIVTADTLLTPMDGGTFANRITLFAGNATRLAAKEAKKKILEIASQMLEADIDDLEIRDKKVFVIGAPHKGKELTDVLKTHFATNHSPIFGNGSFYPKITLPNRSPSYNFGAQSVKAEVDNETGKVNIREVVTAYDCGIPINPLSVEGQVDGAVLMGIGFGLYERFHSDKGQAFNTSFLYYACPTSFEVPKTKMIFIKTDDPMGPFGAKAISEGVKGPTAPAVANALMDLTSYKFCTLPITPEKVFDSLANR